MNKVNNDSNCKIPSHCKGSISDGVDLHLHQLSGDAICSHNHAPQRRVKTDDCICIKIMDLKDMHGDNFTIEKNSLEPTVLIGTEVENNVVCHQHSVYIPGGWGWDKIGEPTHNKLWLSRLNVEHFISALQEALDFNTK